MSIYRCVRTTIWIQSGLNLDRLKLDSIHINRIRTILRSVARAPMQGPAPTHANSDCRIVPTQTLVVSTRRLRTEKHFFIGATGRLIHCRPVTAADLHVDQAGLLVKATLQAIATDADQDRYLTREASVRHSGHHRRRMDFHGRVHIESTLNPVESTSVGGSTESGFDPV